MSASHVGDEKEAETSTTENGAGIDPRKAMRPHNEELIEEQGEMIMSQGQTTKSNICQASPNRNRHDKLLILRDVMQESMKGHYKFMQNNEGRELQHARCPEHTEAGKALKEKFSKLRARQKQSLVLRNRSIIVSSGSAEGVLDAWLEEELDSLWVGVRRHRQGNWEAMPRDPILCFSKGKTVEDLAQSWKKDRLLVFNPGEFGIHGSSLHSCMLRDASDPRINRLQVASTTSPANRDQVPLGRQNIVEQELLLGGFIQIPMVRLDPIVNTDSSQIQPGSSYGTVSI